VAFILGVLV